MCVLSRYIGLCRITSLYLRTNLKMRNIQSQNEKTSSLLLGWTPVIHYYIKNSLQRLHFIQNAVARVLTGTKKKEHISPILVSLPWLPVKIQNQIFSSHT